MSNFNITLIGGYYNKKKGLPGNSGQKTAAPPAGGAARDGQKSAPARTSGACGRRDQIKSRHFRGVYLGNDTSHARWADFPARDRGPACVLAFSKKRLCRFFDRLREDQPAWREARMASQTVSWSSHITMTRVPSSSVSRRALLATSYWSGRYSWKFCCCWSIKP